MIGKVYKHKPDFRSGQISSMVCFNGKLYFRCEETKPKPFVVVDTETLEELKVEFELEKEETNLEWKESEEIGRFLTFTPMFTDGTFLYVVAQ